MRAWAFSTQKGAVLIVQNGRAAYLLPGCSLQDHWLEHLAHSRSHAGRMRLGTGRLRPAWRLVVQGSALVAKTINPDASSAGGLHALVLYCPAVACPKAGFAYGPGSSAVTA